MYMNARAKRLLLAMITGGSLLTLTACHHKTPTPSTAPGAAGPAATAGAAPAKAPASGTASGMSSGGGQTSGAGKGSTANACGANGS